MSEDTPRSGELGTEAVEDRAAAATSSAHAEEWPPPALARRLEALVLRVGDLVSWLWLALIGVIVLAVVLRYVFGSGRIELEELQWHLYAIGFLFGLSTCVSQDAHVRVDALRDRLAPRTRAWIELYGLLLLLLPFIALVGTFSLPFVFESFASGEVSPSPGGLPWRFAIKAALPVAFALVAVAWLARLLRVWRFLFLSASDTGR